MDIRTVMVTTVDRQLRVGSGLGLLCCGIAVFGFSSSSAAQGAYSPPANPVAAAPGQVIAPAAGPNAPPGAPAPVEAPGGAPPAWIITPLVEVGETYNDNVSLAPKGSETWDVITSISPGIRVLGQTARFNGGLTYNPQELIFARTTPTNTLQQRLQGTGRAEVLHELLFFDAAASIDQEFVRPTGPIGPTTLTTNNNLQTVEAASGSPSVVQHFGPYADSETRYRFAYVTTSGGAIAPTQINEARQVLSSGQWFGPLTWQLTGDWTKLDRLKGTTDPTGGTSGKDELARADLKYLVYAGVSVIGGGGYERIVDPTLGFRPSGPIWNAGLAYEPNPYLSGAVTYGRRFDRSDVGFNAKYAPSPDLVLGGSYAQTVQTTPSQIAGNLSQVTVGPNGTLINSQTGLPFVPNSAAPGGPSNSFGIVSGAFLQKRFEADIDVIRDRNTYHAVGYYVKASGQTSAVTSEKIVGGAIGWTRQLWPELKSTVSGSYDRASFLDGSGRIDNTYAVSVGLAYIISRTATARISLSRYDTQSNSPGNSIINDLVMATFRKEF